MAKQLVKFMNERLQREMDKLWESGEMSNEKLQKMQPAPVSCLIRKIRMYLS